jgi:hypothetical protein
MNFFFALKPVHGVRMALHRMLHKMNDRLADIMGLFCEKNIIIALS